ncbi:hypothetical protein D1BOALGB6SA_1199 [Olavius sp. associated proteobacterium Delta 1]|nr:hypothetical protein D1BOALGB6SA_1199 [Olavius sp. associated proteobacterium Delta 1]
MIRLKKNPPSIAEFRTSSPVIFFLDIFQATSYNHFIAKM